MKAARELWKKILLYGKGSGQPNVQLHEQRNILQMQITISNSSLVHKGNEIYIAYLDGLYVLTVKYLQILQRKGWVSNPYI